MRMKIFRNLLFPIFTLICSTFVHGEEFRGEAGLFYNKFETESNAELTLTALGGRIYIEPLSTADHPWYEADFLEHKSYAQAIVGKTDMTISNQDGDGTFITALYNHVIPGSLFNLGVSYSKSDVDFDSVNTSIEMTDVGIYVGKYLTPDMGIRFFYDQITQSATGFPDTDVDEYGLNYKQVIKLQNSQAVNVVAGIKSIQFDDGTIDGSNTEFGVSGDFYFNQQFGIGVGFVTNSGDDKADEGNTIEARSSIFFTPNVYAELKYKSFSVDDTNQGEDDTSTELSVIGRF